MAAGAIVAQPKSRPYRPNPIKHRSLKTKLRLLERFIAATATLDAARMALAEAAFTGDAKLEAKAQARYERAYQAHKKALWNL